MPHVRERQPFPDEPTDPTAAELVDEPATTDEDAATADTEDAPEADDA
jgi:hypothetical protein